MAPSLIANNFVVVLGTIYGSLFYGIYLITLGLYLHSFLSYRSLRSRSTTNHQRRHSLNPSTRRDGQGQLDLEREHGRRQKGTPVSPPTRPIRQRSGSLQPFSALLFTAVIMLSFIMTAEMVSTSVYSVYVLSIYTGSEEEGRVVPRSVHMWSTFISLVDVLFATLLSDVILIYRTWTIYGRRRKSIIIFPLLATCMGVACFAAALPFTAKAARQSLGHGNTIGVTRELKVLGFTAWLGTILTNVYCTMMIVWRLRAVASPATLPSPVPLPQHSVSTSLPTPIRTNANDLTTRLNRVALVITSSGALNALFTFGLGATYLANPSYINCVLSGTVQVIGLSFNLMAWRVGRERERKSTTRVQADGGGDGDGARRTTSDVEAFQLSTMRFRTAITNEHESDGGGLGGGEDSPATLAPGESLLSSDEKEKSKISPVL